MDVEFERLPTPWQVQRIQCGWGFAVLISGDATVHGVGRSNFTQIDCLPETASGAAAGMHHSLFAVPDGILGRGAFRAGQLGPASPFSLPCGSPAVQLAAGARFSLALADDERTVWAWGDNRLGQFGTRTREAALTPVPLPLRPHERVLRLVSGWSFAVALTDAGRVLTWGRSDYGQLGRAAGSASWEAEIPDAVIDVACGSEHALALTQGGEVYAWGWNEHGNCGTGGTHNVQRPQKVRGLSGHVRLIGCGGAHSWAVI